MAKINLRFTRIRTKVVIGIVLIALVTSGLTTMVLYNNARIRLRQNMRQQLIDLVSMAALQIDADSHTALIQPSQEGNAIFMQIKGVLQKIRNVNPDIRYVYTMRQDEQGRILFVVDAETDPNNLSHLGDIYEDAGPYLKANFSTLDKPAAETVFYTDIWGTWLTGYAPFYNSNGQREGVLGMAIAAAKVISRERQFLWLALVTYAAMIPLIIGLGWLGGKWLTAPIEQLIQGTQRIASGDLNHRVYLKTKDEISTLAETINGMTGNLQTTITELEQRVTERTKEIQKRSDYLEAVVQVGRSITSVMDGNQPIQQVVEQVKENFYLYYIGIFLLDDSGDWAELMTGTGEAGQEMLNRGHRIRTGSGMVGWCISQGQARVSPDVNLDDIHLKTAELPETRSEAAIPLRSRGRVIGAITYQSNRPGVFDDVSISVFQVMADQIAIAIDNAKLFAEYQAALETARKSYSDINRMAWGKILQSGGLLGYRSDESGLKSLSESPEHVEEKPSLKNISAGNIIHFPITIRGLELGAVEAVRPEGKGEWTNEEIAILEELTDHLSVAVDNARLYSDSQLRAERERRLAEITAKVRASTNLDIILKTSIQELTQALHLKQGSILLKGGEGGITHE